MPKPSKNAAALAKYLTYVLGRRPDEFGLVTSAEGYVPVKELLKALREEDGWQHLRLAHINEVVYSVLPCPVEIEGNQIRAKQREQLPNIMIPQDLPKLLYIAIRQRAYPHVVQRGLAAGGRPHLVLSSQKEMALKLGHRVDHHPVLLTVHVGQSMDAGADYKQYGQDLYLASTIPAETFSGPALPKEKAWQGKQRPDQPPPRDQNPGSYFPDLSMESDADPPTEQLKKKRRSKTASWKKARKQERKHKARQQRH